MTHSEKALDRSLRVLLVEDEDMIAMLTEEMLSDLGYEIGASVPNLSKGVEVATHGTFDIAVLDINLRGVESYPVADILTQRGIPFIFASGYAAKGVDPRFNTAPVLQKPFTTEALGEVLVRARMDCASRRAIPP